jgi:hypothetical protein
MTKLVPITCPGCKSPVYGKDVDSVILCSRCGTLQARNGTVSVVEYEAGAFTKASDGEKLYLPFWKLGVAYDIKTEVVQGGLLGKLAGTAGKTGAGGIVLMLPAFDLEPLKFKEIAKTLTLQPPAYTPGPIEPSVRRESCKVTLDMTDEMADFVFVTIEAEKPGTLQNLVYDLKVNAKKLVFLPYFKKGNDLVPGY